jgi:hypothetical protein
MEGVPPGERCDNCRREISRRAARIARWVAMGSTAVLALYVVLRVPEEPRARVVGAASVLIWYLLTSRMVRRIAQEWIK